MKLFRRMNAMLLALALIISMIPVGILRISAAEHQSFGYLHAAYTGEVLQPDGMLEESAYRQNTFLSGGLKLGAVFDGQTLQIGLNSANPGITGLTINGVAVSSAAITGSNTTEYAVALKDVDITDFTKEYTIAFTIGQTDWTGRLVLDTSVFQALKIGYSLAETTSSTGKFSIPLKTAESTHASRPLIGCNYTTDHLTSDVDGATVLEFDLKVNDMPNGAVGSLGRYFAKGGVGLIIRDEDTTKNVSSATTTSTSQFGTEAMLVGLIKLNGQMNLVYWDDGANNGAGKFQTVPVSNTNNDQYHFRVEYIYANATNNDIAARYFINGQLIAEANDVKELNEYGVFVTGGSNIIQVVGFGTDTGDVDAVLSDLSVSHLQPALLEQLAQNQAAAAAVDSKIAAIGTVTLASKPAIQAARAAYAALTSPQKSLVRNLSVLVAAETKLAQLEADSHVPWLYSAYSANAMGFDGKLDEPVYRMNLYVTESLRLAAAWDLTTLYLGFNSADPGISDLTINGKSLNVTPKTGTNTTEYQLPLSDLGISLIDFAGTYPISLRVGEAEWQGKLMFEATNYTPAPIKSATTGTQLSADKLSATVKYGNFSGNITLNPGAKCSSELIRSTQSPAIFEVDVRVNSLPENTANYDATNRFLAQGVTFAVIDDQTTMSGTYSNQAFKLGLYRQNNKIYFGHVSNGTVFTHEIGTYQAGKDYHIRVEYSYADDAAKTVSAMYFVNGNLIAEGSNVRLTISPHNGTGGSEVVLTRIQNLEGVDVTVSNISVSRSQPGIAVSQQIAAIGTVTLASEAAIQAARAAYNGLTSAQKTQVKNLAVLEAAEQTLYLLQHPEEKEQQDKNAAAAVDAKIAAIGNVTLASEAAIKAARTAYEALSDDQKELVTKLAVLEAAELAFIRLTSPSYYLHAGKSAVSLKEDGRVSESAYRLLLSLSTTLKVGAAWDATTLQLVFSDTQAPTVTNIKINGMSFAGTGVVHNGVREIRVPLSIVGISDSDKAYDISFTVNGTSWEGTLVLDTHKFASLAVKSGSLFYGAAASPDMMTVYMNSLLPDANGNNTNRSLFTLATDELASSVMVPTIVEMDVQVNYLPANAGMPTTLSRDFCNGGLSITIRDEDATLDSNNKYGAEAFLIGLCKQDGQLKLVYWADGSFHAVDIQETADQQYHLRAEYSYSAQGIVSAKYFINEQLLAVANNVKVPNGSFSTASTNGIQFYARAKNTQQANRVDVNVSKVSVSHPEIRYTDAQMAQMVDELIAAIGSVTTNSTLSIKKARAAYDALTSGQKKLVTKLATLTAAEAKLLKLKQDSFEKLPAWLHARYADNKQDMILDGKLDETVWAVNIPLSNTLKIGAAWDFGYLYLGIKGSSLPGSLTNVKINGVSVSPTTAAGTNTREYRIPISQTGIREAKANKSYTLSFTLDGKTWSGTLVLGSGKYSVLTPSNLYYGASADVSAKTMVVFDTNHANANSHQQLATFASSSLAYSLLSPTILEFSLSVQQMPENGKISGTPSRSYIQGGISVTVRDDDLNLNEAGSAGCEAMVLGFCQLEGQMMLVYWDDAAGAFQTIPMEDLDSGSYRIRVEYHYSSNNDVSAKFFVNGRLLGEAADVKYLNGSFGTTSTNIVLVMARGDGTDPVQAKVSDFSVTKNRDLEAPRPLDGLTAQYIFGRTNLNRVTTDLNLPTEYVNKNGQRFPLSWFTSDSSVITKTGKIYRPELEPASATLSLYIEDLELWSVNITVAPRSITEFASPENVDAAFSISPIVIDGVLSEEGWRMGGRVLDRDQQLYAEYSFQWNQTHLFLAVDYIQEATTLSFKLNGRYFIMKDGKLTRGGENVGGSTKIAVNNGVVEMAIPLSVLGLSSKISYYGEVLPLAIKAGNFTGAGKSLYLSGVDWFQTDNRDHEALYASTASTDAYHGVQQLENGWRLFDLYGGSNKANIRSYVSFRSQDIYDKNFADRMYATRIEFDFLAEAMPLVTPGPDVLYNSTAAYSCSGFTFIFGETANSNKFTWCQSCGILNVDSGLAFVVQKEEGNELYPLGKQVGEKFSLGLQWHSNDTLEIFVDGVLLHTVAQAARWSKGGADASVIFNMRAGLAPLSEADNHDVSITNIAFGKIYESTDILRTVTFEEICGKNTSQDKITANLTLPTSLTNGQMDTVYTLTWSSSDPATIDPATGKVTRPKTGVTLVTLTAKLSNGETKTFDLIVHGTTIHNDNVLHAINDTNPALGAGTTYSDLLFQFDTTNNSIIRNLGGLEPVNYVVLNDIDNKARLSAEHLTLWVSNDNITYTQIKEFKLLHMGKQWYLYDFEAEACYVKVHYTLFDGDEADFLGIYGEMIDVGYEDVFGGGKETFTTGTYKLTNNTGKMQYDYAWTISKKALGITGSDASIRISLNGKLLYHYVSGSNVVVRVPELAAGASVVLTVQQSTSKNVLDIANKEGVHEIIYGVREFTTDTKRFYFHTLPAGTVFPDGSKLEVETIYALYRTTLYLSTDGGHSWTSVKVTNNAPAGKTPVEKVSEGGWIFDSVTGRLMYETYNILEASLHAHTEIIASDDGGKTWYLLYQLPCECDVDPYGDNYELSYSGGIQLSTYDGKGPNVDFVFPVAKHQKTLDVFGTEVAYSRDGGETWVYSKTPIAYATPAATEAGLTEAWIMERADGVLILQSRCQIPDEIGFAVAYSVDHGVTWTQEKHQTDFYAINTQPIITQLEVNGQNVGMSVWGGNNVFGNTNYMRNPLYFAHSINGGDTHRGHLNAFFKTSLEGYTYDYTQYITNQSLAKYGEDNMILSFRRNHQGDYVNIYFQDFDKWYSRTKGAYDNFEHGTVRYEGWNSPSGDLSLATQIGRGQYSMQLGKYALAARTVPYLQDGRISLDVYAAEGSSFTLELMSAYSRYYNDIASPVSLRIENNKLYRNEETAPVGQLATGWNTLTFELKLTANKASLQINGGSAIDLSIDDLEDDYICYIAFANMTQQPVYVDELLVISDLDPVLSYTQEDQAAADAVIEKIKNIKKNGNSAASVKDARNAFNALTQAQGDLIDKMTLVNPGAKADKALVNFYDELLMAEYGPRIVEELIDKLDHLDIYIADELKAAESAYAKLTWSQKQQVRNAGQMHLYRLRFDRISVHKDVADKIAAEEVQNLVDKINTANPLRSKDNINTARAAYNQLSGEQKRLVDARALNIGQAKLEVAEEKLMYQSLANMQSWINSLTNVSLQDKALVEGIRALYNKLDDEQKLLVDETPLARAELRLRDLQADLSAEQKDQLLFEGVRDLINNIGTVTLEKKTMIEAARAAYNKLSARQQQLLEEDETAAKLVIAEAELNARIIAGDLIPATNDTARIAPMMHPLLLSALALAVLLLCYFKKRTRR